MVTKSVSGKAHCNLKRTGGKLLPKFGLEHCFFCRDAMDAAATNFLDDEVCGDLIH